MVSNQTCSARPSAPLLPQKYGATPETQSASSSGADTEATFDPAADKHKVRGSLVVAWCSGTEGQGECGGLGTLQTQHKEQLPFHYFH